MCGFRHNRNVSVSHSTLPPCGYSDWVTKGLVRYYGNQELHFITCSCYRRQAQLRSAKCRNLFLKILEETAQSIVLLFMDRDAGTLSSAYSNRLLAKCWW